MKVGISTASFFKRLNNEEALPLLNRWGIPCTEMFFTSFSEYEPRFAEALSADRGRVTVESVHVLSTQYEPQLYADHPRVRADAYAWLQKVMESAQILGAHHYTFHGVARLKRTFRPDFDRLGQKTAEIAAFCERYGVKLCCENVEWALCDTPAAFYALKQRCPQIGAVLDIKQARIAGCDWRDFLTLMGENLALVHVSDCDGCGKRCLPGKGVFEFGELFARLRDAGFAGTMLIESYAEDYADLQELCESFVFLQETAQKYGL